MSNAWDVYVDILLTSDGSVLLLRGEGTELWQVPAAPLSVGDDPLARAKEVAREFLGLDVEWVELAWAEARRVAGRPVLILHYRADAPGYPQPGPGVAEARFFQVEHLPPLPEPDRVALYTTLTA